jgi:hypothetical protein
MGATHRKLDISIIMIVNNKFYDGHVMMGCTHPTPLCRKITTDKSGRNPRVMGWAVDFMWLCH